MKQPGWTIALLVFGLLCMLLGPVVTSWLYPATAIWSEQDAAALSKAGADLHAAMHAHGKEDEHHGHSTNELVGHEHSVSELASAEAAYQLQQQRLDRLLSRRNWLLVGTRVLGVILALAGIIGLVMNRRSV